MDENQKQLRRDFTKKQWENRKKNPKSYLDIRKKMSDADKGRPSPHKGKKFPSLIGNTNGFKKGNKPWNKGMGNKSLNQRIRSSKKYQEWRSQIFERDNWTCQTCRLRGCSLEAHHSPKEFSQILKENNIKTFDEAMNCIELWDISNGVTLCEDCHKLTKCGKQER